MSYYSYTTITCSFPADTKVVDPTLYHIEHREDGRDYIKWDAETKYADDILYDLNATFGKRLDEVPGLELSLHYSTDEDGHWEFYLELEDGKWKYEESEIVFKEKPVEQSYVDLDAGTPLSRAKRIWERLGDVPVDDEDNIDESVYFYDLGYYPKGTFREDIWHDIEGRTGISVAYLMGEAKNPDGSN